MSIPMVKYSQINNKTAARFFKLCHGRIGRSKVKSTGQPRAVPIPKKYLCIWVTLLRRVSPVNKKTSLPGARDVFRKETDSWISIFR